VIQSWLWHWSSESFNSWAVPYYYCCLQQKFCFFSFYCKWQLAFSIIVNFFLYSLWRCFYLWIPWICIPLLTMLNRMCRYLMGHYQINSNPFLQLWVDCVWYDTRCYFNVRSKTDMSQSLIYRTAVTSDSLQPKLTVF